MSPPRIFVATPLHEPQRLLLDPAPSNHLLRVLRLRPHAPVVLFDGRGGEWDGELVGNDGKRALIELKCHRPSTHPSPLKTTLAIGVSRGERMDWVVQKCTELGVERIQPLRTERVEVRLAADRWARKRDHWQQVAVSACEQSGRDRVPQIDAIEALSDWLPKAEAELKLALHPGGSAWPALAPRPESVVLLCGPEGGFSSSEVEQMGVAGFQVCGLGPRVLRTETAPVAGLSVAQFLWGDWRQEEIG